MRYKIGLIIAGILTVGWSVLNFIIAWVAYKDFFVNYIGQLPNFPDWCWNIIFFLANTAMIAIITGLFNYGADDKGMPL